MMEKEDDFTSYASYIKDNQENEEAEFLEKICVDASPEYIETLPLNFDSLIDQPIELTDTDPEAVIELLGSCLGISNYKTNMAAFWFLDALSLQVLKYQSKHDAYYRSIFVSWLVGEFQAIRRRKLSRTQFFNDINELFCTVFVDINSNQPLLYWEQIFADDIMQNAPPLIKEEEMLTRQSFIEEYLQNISKLSSHRNMYYENNAFGLHLNNVFNTIVEATYDFFGNEFRYALIHEVFVIGIKKPTKKICWFERK